MKHQKYTNNPNKVNAGVKRSRRVIKLGSHLTLPIGQVVEVYVDLKSELALESRNSWVIQLVYAYSPNSPAAAYYANCDSSSGLSGQQFAEKSATTTTRSSITMNEVKWSGVAWRGVAWCGMMRCEVSCSMPHTIPRNATRVVVNKQLCFFIHFWGHLPEQNVTTGDWRHSTQSRIASNVATDPEFPDCPDCPDFPTPI